MRLLRRSTLVVAVPVLLTLAFALNCEAQESKYRVQSFRGQPPKGLAQKVSKVLNPVGYRISGSADKIVCEIWFRKDLTILKDFEPEGDLVYPIPPGSLIGAIHFPKGGSDFRQQKIKQGVYTLRYAHQPIDGAHLDTASHRDYLLVCAAAEDKSLAVVGEDEGVELSKKASGTEHPAILSLRPPQEGRDTLPIMVHDEDFNLDILVAKTSGKAGSEAKDVQIELVTVGHFEE